jgi:hypothetical protein
MIKSRAINQSEQVSGRSAELARWRDPYDRNEPYNRTSLPKPFFALSPAASVMAD